MRHLIERGMMSGRPVPVDSPAPAGRADRALRRRAGRGTARSGFRLDIAGLSPGVGSAPGGRRCVHPTGAPLPDAAFTAPRGILRRRIGQDEARPFAPAPREVAGELSGPARLTGIRRVTLRAGPAGGPAAGARRLAERIARPRSDPDARWDDLPPPSSGRPDVRTAHVGGSCAPRGVGHPAAISPGPRAALGPLPGEGARHPAERNGIARFREAGGLVQPIVTARGRDAADAPGPDLARARAGRDRVNILRAELSPCRARRRFICRRPAFCAACRGWSAAQRDDVAAFLARERLADRADPRAAPLGPGPGMEQPRPGGEGKDPADPVGPRGAVRRWRG